MSVNSADHKIMGRCGVDRIARDADADRLTFRDSDGRLSALASTLVADIQAGAVLTVGDNIPR